MTRITNSMLIALCLLSFSASAHQIKIPNSIDDLSVTKVAENVYVLHGVIGMPDKNNKGFMSNSSFIVSDAGVVIVDTGGSLKYGEYLVTKIREVTDKPVVAIINTHMHGDHWLGNAALRKAFPDTKIYAHEKAVNRLKSGEAQQWLDLFAAHDAGRQRSDVQRRTVDEDDAGAWQQGRVRGGRNRHFLHAAGRHRRRGE